MFQVLLALPLLLLGLALLLGVLVALAFFVGVVSYGWLHTIAPEAELAQLTPARRRVVMLRAIVVLAVFWMVLLGVNARRSQRTNPDTGEEAFAFWLGTLRRLSGLPPRSAGS